MPRARSLLCASLVALASAACASQDRAPNPGGTERRLGEPFTTRHGDVHLIRVQDEYRLIKCIPEGPIAGCYMDVLRVPRDVLTDETTSATPGAMRWNRWFPVEQVPGLEIAFLAPDRIALREQPQAAPQK